MPLYRFASILLLVLYIILNSTNYGLIDLTGVKEGHAWCKFKKAFKKIAIYVMWCASYSLVI